MIDDDISFNGDGMGDENHPNPNLAVHQPNNRGFHSNGPNLVVFNTGNFRNSIPRSYEYKSIHDMLNLDCTIFFKVAGRLLRITQGKESGGKPPGFTFSYKAKKREEIHPCIYSSPSFSRFDGYWNCFVYKGPQRDESLYLGQVPGLQNLHENQKNGKSCPCYSSGDARHASLH